MWVVWMLYFFQFAAVGIYWTYLNVYYREAGLSGTQIGLLGMATALVAVGSAVIWGYLSDRTGRPHLMIAIGALGGLAVAQGVPYVNGFWPFLVLGVIGTAMNSAPMTLVDSTTLTLLGDRREDYGLYRLGGTFGFIITAFISGFILERFGLKMVFPIYGGIMLCFALTALALPRVALRTETRSQSDFGKLMANPAWLLFIGCVFLMWVATNAAMSFLNVALNAMGASQSLLGIVATVAAVAELPFMYFNNRLLRRFGPLPLLTVGIALQVVRTFLFGIMPAPEWAIGINMINGAAFVFFWNSAVNYANRMAPKGLEGTTQGMLTSTVSLAGVISSLVVGWLFDQLGPNGIFQVMSVVLLASLILFMAGNAVLARRERLNQVETGG